MAERKVLKIIDVFQLTDWLKKAEQNITPILQ
jgi:hypothetical protein